MSHESSPAEGIRLPIPTNRCPDGYRGGYNQDGNLKEDAKKAREAAEALDSDDEDEDAEEGTKEHLKRRKQFGYKEYRDKFDGNPFSNKVIIMDEVHNLINPPPEILNDETKLEALMNLRHMLQTATNSVLVGLTATPLGENEDNDGDLLDVIRGDANVKDSTASTDEGFVSFFMDQPQTVFPQLRLMSTLPESTRPGTLTASGLEPRSVIRSFELNDFAGSKGGNLSAYRQKAKEFLMYVSEPERPDDEDGFNEKIKFAKKQTETLARYCSLGMAASKLDQYNVFDILKGTHSPKTPGSTCTADGADQEEPAEAEGAADENANAQTPQKSTKEPKLLGVMLPVTDEDKDEDVLMERAHGFCTKLEAVVSDILEANEVGEVKTLVLVHTKHGYQLLPKLLKEKKVKVLCYDGKEQTKDNLGKFNSEQNNLRGEKFQVMVADAKQVSQGVSFFAVRKLILVDVPPSWDEYVQRVGRAVRFNGHPSVLKSGDKGLDDDEKTVEVIMYQALLPEGPERSVAGAAGSSDGGGGGGGGAVDAHATADEVLVARLRASTKDSRSRLKKLREVAFDKGMWDGEQAQPSESTGPSEIKQQLEAAIDFVKDKLGDEHQRTDEQLRAAEAGYPRLRAALKAALPVVKADIVGGPPAREQQNKLPEELQGRVTQGLQYLNASKEEEKAKVEKVLRGEGEIAMDDGSFEEKVQQLNSLANAVTNAPKHEISPDLVAKAKSRAPVMVTALLQFVIDATEEKGQGMKMVDQVITAATRKIGKKHWLIGKEVGKALAEAAKLKLFVRLNDNIKDAALNKAIEAIKEAKKVDPRATTPTPNPHNRHLRR